MYPDKEMEFDIAHAKISLKIVEVRLTSSNESTSALTSSQAIKRTSNPDEPQISAAPATVISQS